MAIRIVRFRRVGGVCTILRGMPVLDGLNNGSFSGPCLWHNIAECVLFSMSGSRLDISIATGFPDRSIGRMPRYTFTTATPLQQAYTYLKQASFLLGKVCLVQCSNIPAHEISTSSHAPYILTPTKVSHFHIIQYPIYLTRARSPTSQHPHLAQHHSG